jgi:type IV pilus assembly protein PilV
MSRIPHRGFTLLEVLIALLIFSLGLMGLAGLLTVSVRTNHSAYLRTQAMFLAQGMEDRMRANGAGLWAGLYTLHAIVTPPATPGAAVITGTLTDCSAGCPIATIATRDMQAWQNQLNTFLPNPGAAIACNAPSPVGTAKAPYSTTCEIQISWTQLGLDNQNSTPPDVFDWVFQP